MTRRERLCPAPTYRAAAVVVAALGAAVPGPAEGQHTEDSGLPDGEEVRFRSGELELAGLWFTPAGQGPFPAAVIIRGSGESRRDNPWARLFVDVLLENDVAVLMPDKRGSGASGGDWRTATFTDLAEDALAAVRHVSSRPEVDPERVGLVGLSQGGRVAPVAAAQSSEVAFVVNVVGSAVPFVEQIDHEMEHTFREVGLSGDDLGAAMALHDVAKRYVGGEIPWDTYRSALDSALDSEWTRAAEGFPRHGGSLAMGILPGRHGLRSAGRSRTTREDPTAASRAGCSRRFSTTRSGRSPTCPAKHST